MSYPNGPQPGGEQPQWGQPQTGGQPAQPQGQWGAPQTGGQPAAPQGQWGAPQQPAGQTWGQQMGQTAAGVKGGFDAASVRPGQWIALVFWILAIVAASLPFVSVSAYGYSASASGWNSTNVVFMFIFSLIAAAAAAVEVFVPSMKLPVPMAFVTGGALALAGVFGLLAFLVNLDVIDSFGVGAWIVLIVALAAIAGGVLEIMHGMKQPKAPTGGGQWGAGGGGQWGQPAQAPQQQWGQPGQQPGQPGQPGQQQWGQPGQ